MKTAKKVLLCVSLITLSLALVLAPFTGAIEGDVTAGITTDGVWDITSDDILSVDSLLASLSDTPTTCTVHPTDDRADFQTIQSAIYKSNNGDSIEVWNGTYKESVVLNKQLTIYSRDGAIVTIIDAGGFGSAITIKADSCTVDGFMATGSEAFLGDAGIIVKSNGNNIMNNLCCANGNHGIYLYRSSNNRILNNNCSENAMAGIYLVHSSNNIISYNEINNSYYGLYISGSSDNVVSNNEICRNIHEGVYVMSSSNNRIYFNDFVKNNPNVGSDSSNTTIWNSTREYNYTYNGRKYRSYIGNYFSDYDGDENDRDGIGMYLYFIYEKPTSGFTLEYRISGDSYPLIRPFKFYILENVLSIIDVSAKPLNCKIQITSRSSSQDRPSIVYANGFYYVAYQSLEKGYGIYIKKFDYLWNFKKKVEVVSGSAYYDSPSLAFANNKLYVAYISNAEGANEKDYDIIVKEYDPATFACTSGEKYLTTMQSCQDLPALYYKDGYFYLAYQSWETGNGDIYINKFDSNWNELKKVQVTTKSALQDRPSITYADGYFYVAYFSEETGYYDIFVKRLKGPNLNLYSWKKQITSKSSYQSYPAITFVNNQFTIAYASTETGTLGIYMKTYDNNWNYIGKTKVIDDNSAHERRPSITYAQNDLWIAYVHNLVGSDDWNIFAIIPCCEQN